MELGRKRRRVEREKELIPTQGHMDMWDGRAKWTVRREKVRRMRRMPDVLHIRKAGLPGQDPLLVTIPVRRALEMAFHRRCLSCNWQSLTIFNASKTVFVFRLRT